MAMHRILSEQISIVVNISGLEVLCLFLLALFCTLICSVLNESMGEALGRAFFSHFESSEDFKQELGIQYLWPLTSLALPPKTSREHTEAVAAIAQVVVLMIRGEVQVHSRERGVIPLHIEEEEVSLQRGSRGHLPSAGRANPQAKDRRHVIFQAAGHRGLFQVGQL